jgi:hypothetical protein
MALEAFEAAEWESESESESEAAEAASRKPPKRPSSQPSFRPRQPPGAQAQYVTQTQLEAALARSDGKVKTVADGVSTINARLAALAASAKKEAETRKKSVDGGNKDLNSKLQMLALLPLLVTPPTTQSVTVSGTTLIDEGGKQIKHLVKPDKSTLDALLPLLLVSGMGTPGATGMGFGGDGSDSSMMMLALVLAMSNKG